MSKQNDLVLNILENPHMTIEDFLKVGFSADNTSLENEDVYTKSKVITENPLFLNLNGTFDKTKFHNFYLAAAKGMNLINTVPQDFKAVYSKYNIFAPVEQRDMSPQFELVKFDNPDRITRSMLSVGMTGPREFTPLEIALSLQIYDSKTGKWIDTPEDLFSFNKLFSDVKGFFGDNFGTTKVMAQYEEDVDINGKKRGEFGFDENNIAHSKGEYKLNENGTYYYRTLNDNENIYDKQVLHYSDILTREGSALNSIDFLDSDDIQKSTFGSFVKNASLIGAMFLPVVGEAIAGATIFLQAAGLGATLGKIALGSDNTTMNWIEGFSEATNPINTRSEYSKTNTWTIENLLGTVGDVVGLLRLQRLLFKYAPVIFKGKLGTSAKNQQLLQEEYFKDLKGEYKTLLDTYKKGSLQYAKAQAELLTLDLKAAKMVEDYMKDYYKYGEELSKAYMTLLTVNDIYGEAKQAGALDFDAALITSGYAAMEYALLSTDIGKWILPELRAQRIENKAILNALTKDVRETFAKLGKEAATSEEAKRTYLLKLVDFGKNTAKSVLKGEFAVGLGKRASLEGGTGLLKAGVGSVMAGGFAEALEETSEELLADFSKVLYNGLELLQGKESRMTPFENVVDRYGMSFLGGFLGGGISSAAFDFSDIKRNINMTSKDAMLKIIYKARNNDLDSLYKIINDVEVANKNLSATKFDKDENGNLIWKSADGNDNQDFAVKLTVKRLLNMVQDTLDAHGGNMSDPKIIDALILRDLRYRALSNTTTAGLYIQKYNQLVSDLVDKTLQLLELNSPKAKAEAGETDKKDDKNPELEKKRSVLEKEIKELDKEIQDFNSGKLAPLFMTTALLESTPYILSPLMQSTFKEYAEKQSNTEFNKIPEAQLAELQAKYFNYLKTDKKDDLLIATDRYLKLQNNLRDSLNQLQELLKAQEANPEIIELMQDFSAKIEALEFVEKDLDTLLDGLQLLASESQYAGKFIQQLIKLLNNTISELTEEYSKKYDEYEKSLDEEEARINLQSQEAFEKGLIDEETLNNNKRIANIEKAERLNTYKTEIDNKIQEAFENKRKQILIDGLLKQATELADLLIKLGYLTGAVKDKVFAHLDGVLSSLEEYNSTLQETSSFFLNNVESVENGDIPLELMVDADETFLKKYNDYKYSKEVLTPAIEEFKNKINQVKNLKYTPVLNDLNQFALSINGINISQLLEKLGKVFNSNAGNLSTFTMSSLDYNAITESEKVINLFIAALEGARTDNVDPFGTRFSSKGVEDKSNLWGINKVINEVHVKAPKIENDSWQDLPELEGNIANMAEEDLKSILKLLQTYKKLYNLNQGLKLNLQTRVSTKTTLLLYDKIKRLLSNIDLGDKDLEEKAKSIISGFNTLDDLTSGNVKDWNLDLIPEQLENIEKERLQFEDSVYKFFQESGILENEEALQKLFNVKNFDLSDRSIHSLTEQATSIEDSSFIGYIASIASIKASDFYFKFKDILTGDVAPLISLELAVRLGVANIVNGPVITTIIKAYRLSLVEWYTNASISERKQFLKKSGYSDGTTIIMALDCMAPLFLTHDLVPQYDNLILIDGRPGTGKSAATAKLIAKFIQEYKSELTNNTWVIHGGDTGSSTESSKILRDAIGLDETNPIFNRILLLQKISSDYVAPKLENGQYKYDEKDYTLTDDGKLIPNWKITNTDEIPSIIIIDEVQQFTQLELTLIDKFAKEHGISVICLGDTSQSLTHSSFKLNDALENKIKEEAKKEGLDLKIAPPFLISLDRTQVLHCPKLGTSMRTANNLKNQNTIATEVAYETGNGELQLHYYEDDSTLAGDVIINNDNLIIQYVDKLIDLGVTKIHFATYDNDSNLSKILQNLKKYSDVIERHDGVGLGLEGDYWIIELDPEKNGQDSIMLDFYSGQTRSKLFTIISFNNTIKTPVGEITVTNVKDLETHEETLSSESIRKYALLRKNLLEKLIKSGEEIPYVARTAVTSSEVTSEKKTPTKEEPKKELPSIVEPSETEEIKNKAKEIVDNAITFDTSVTVNEPATIVEYYGRKIILLDINGFKIPFYCSTGKGGKKNVESGKWYPILGIDPEDGWLMKGDLDLINSYYGSVALKAIAKLLDEKYGDIRDTTTEYADPKKLDTFYLIINLNLTPVQNNLPDSIVKINAIINQMIPEIDARFNGTYEQLVPETTSTPDESQEIVEPEEISEFTETLDTKEAEIQINESTLETNDEEEKIVPPQGMSAKEFLYYLFSNASFELGVDPSTLQTGEIVYSEDETRIDSLNGFRNVSKISNYESILNIQGDLNNAVQILGKLRRVLFSTLSKSDIEKHIGTILGINKVYVRFGLKTSELKNGGLNTSPEFGKLEKGKNEILPYLRATKDENDASTVNNRNLVAIIGSDSNDLIEIPLFMLNNPITMINLTDADGKPVYSDIYNVYNLAYNLTSGNYGNKLIAGLQAVLNFIDSISNKKDFEGIYYLITNYLNTDRHITFIEDLLWTPKNNLIHYGVDLNINRGILSEYYKGNADYILTQNYIPLSEYLKQPDLVVSQLMRYEDKSGKITDVNGHLVDLHIKRNHPFVLYTDLYLTHDGVELNSANILDEYLYNRRNHIDSIKLVYVLPPTFTIKEYIDSLVDFTVNKKGSPLGNLVTAYKILQQLFLNDADKTKTLFTNAFGLDLGILVYNKVLNTLHRLQSMSSFDAIVKELTETSEAWNDLGKIGIPTSIPLYRLLLNIIKQLVYPASLKINSLDDGNIKLVYDPRGVNNIATLLPIMEEILADNNKFYYLVTGDKTTRKNGFSVLKDLETPTSINNSYMKNKEFTVHGGLATSTFLVTEGFNIFLQKQSNDNDPYIEGYSGFEKKNSEDDKGVDLFILIMNNIITPNLKDNLVEILTKDVNIGLSDDLSVISDLINGLNYYNIAISKDIVKDATTVDEFVDSLINYVNNNVNETIAFSIQLNDGVTKGFIVQNSILKGNIIFNPKIIEPTVGQPEGEIIINDTKYTYSINNNKMALKETIILSPQSASLDFSSSFDDIDPQTIENNFDRLKPLFDKLILDGDYPLHEELEEAVANNDFESIAEIINDEMGSKMFFEELSETDALNFGLYELNDIFKFEENSNDSDESEEIESCSYITLDLH